MTRIEVLFPEFCSLFADSSNIRYLEKCLPDAEFVFTSYMDEPEEYCQQRHLQRRPFCAGLRPRYLARKAHQIDPPAASVRAFPPGCLRTRPAPAK